MEGSREQSRRAVPIREAIRRLAQISVVGGLSERLEQERARWFVWLPVALGGGIAAYFALPTEPDLWVALTMPVMAGGLLAATRKSTLMNVAALGLLAAGTGFAAAKLRTEAARAPVLAHEIRRADVRGFVERIEPRPTRGERVTIRVTHLAGVEPDARPKRIRVRVMTRREGMKPGDTIRLRATLRPPSAPALPGGYDFARWSWFKGLGATGYAIQAPEIIAVAARERSLLRAAQEKLERVRQAMGERIRAVVPGETGAIAVSLITGERGGITDATNAAYRDSGLVHILSISGLHMAIMAGSVYAAVRILLAAFHVIALQFSIKKWAAAAALVGAAGYLLVSGGSIPTVRAFLMIAIMFTAVMLDRQALAMRNVAIAALIVLLATPESLLDAGFQMSFAAVVSLIAAYESIRARAEKQTPSAWLRPVAYLLGGIVLSTVVASLAVAPIGVYHFHASQQYALLANLLAVPICNLVIMPAALVTLILMPFGLEALPLPVMAHGIDAMSWTAYWVAALPGAVVKVADIPTVSFALMIAGGLWLTLWQTRWRVLGLVAIGGGMLVAAGGEGRPDILAGRNGELVAVRAENGRFAALGTRSGGFELSRWLEHDGDGRLARDVLKTRAFRCDGTGCSTVTKGLRVAVARHPAAIAEDCLKSDIVVTDPRPPAGCTAPQAVIDRWTLRRDGTHAIYLEQDPESGKTRIARIETVAGRRGARPWTARADHARASPGQRVKQSGSNPPAASGGD